MPQIWSERKKNKIRKKVDKEAGNEDSWNDIIAEIVEEY